MLLSLDSWLRSSKKAYGSAKSQEKKRYDACVFLANCSRIDMWMFTLRWCHLEGESRDNDLNSVHGGLSQPPAGIIVPRKRRAEGVDYFKNSGDTISVRLGNFNRIQF